MLEPNVEGYEIPATMINGAEVGMTLVVTAGIHSGENPGVAALPRIANELDPAKLRGRILLIHCVNTSGFWAKSPALVPEDGFNLNKDYPGKAGGSTGERIADFFVSEIFPQADFIVDLHSGGAAEPLTPCLFFPASAGEEAREASLAAAMALDIPYIIASQAVSGEYSYAAAAMGIPGLLLERGHSGLCREEWVRAYCRDLRLLLDHFAMYSFGASEGVCGKSIFEKTVYLTSDRAGLWYPLTAEGGDVKKGDLLGYIEDFYGERISQFYAQGDGVVFYYSAGLAVNPGDPLVAYGLTEHMEYYDSGCSVT